jgi:hypothetical protein
VYIGDWVAVPAEHSDHYSEKLVLMPPCYIVNDYAQVFLFLYFFMGGMFWLFIVELLCYICIFYYMYVVALTYAFGWSAFLCRVKFLDTLVVIFFKVNITIIMSSFKVQC